MATERKSKPTARQRLAIDKMVENGGIVSRAMIDAKYSLATAKTPQKLTESKGFQQLCEERGLTDNFLVDALVEDIGKKPQNRKPELELAFKIRGKISEATQTQNNIFVFNDEAKEKARELIGNYLANSGDDRNSS